MQELLKIIYEADEILNQYKSQCQSEKVQMMRSIVTELTEIDHKIDRHYQEQVR